MTWELKSVVKANYKNNNNDISGEHGGCSRISHCQRRKSSGVTPCIVTKNVPPSVVIFSWALDDYDLFAKVKEPLRRARYIKRDEPIRAIGRSIRNTNNDGRADGVRCLPNIRQNMVERRVTILKVHKSCTPVIKAMSEISNCCHYLSSNPCVIFFIKNDSYKPLSF